MPHHHPLYPSPVTITTTDTREIYGNDLRPVHQDKIFQKCLHYCSQIAYQKSLPRLPIVCASDEESINWRHDRTLALKRFQLQTLIEFHLFVFLDPRLVDKNVHLRTGVTELAFFVEKTLFVKAESKEKYLKVKSGIIDYLKDIMCRLTLKLSKNTPSLQSFAKIVANYSMITQGIPRPWNVQQLMRRRAIDLSYMMKRFENKETELKSIASSAAGAA